MPSHASVPRHRTGCPSLPRAAVDAVRELHAAEQDVVPADGRRCAHLRAPLDAYLHRLYHEGRWPMGTLCAVLDRHRQQIHTRLARWEANPDPDAHDAIRNLPVPVRITATTLARELRAEPLVGTQALPRRVVATIRRLRRAEPPIRHRYTPAAATAALDHYLADLRARGWTHRALTHALTGNPGSNSSVINRIARAAHTPRPTDADALPTPTPGPRHPRSQLTRTTRKVPT